MTRLESRSCSVAPNTTPVATGCSKGLPRCFHVGVRPFFWARAALDSNQLHTPNEAHGSLDGTVRLDTHPIRCNAGHNGWRDLHPAVLRDVRPGYPGQNTASTSNSIEIMLAPITDETNRRSLPIIPPRDYVHYLCSSTPANLARCRRRRQQYVTK
jgi:hypothetical protein